MNIRFVKAVKEDADRLIEIYNSSFYKDYIRYGQCPAYGRSRENMEESIEKIPKFIIYVDETPIGAISVENRGVGEYYLGCICIIPEYQGKGIGTLAFKFVIDYYSDWRRITLITPMDKKENISFYTSRFGFKIDSEYTEGNVKLAHFLLER
jgi:ribosomal protein S18 acetylase RimI-like enzyme